MSLERENQIYRLPLIDLLGVNNVNEGKFAVVKGEEMQGPFDSYDAALGFAYGRYGIAPFLVKKIERNETVLYFSRGLG